MTHLGQYGSEGLFYMVFKIAFGPNFTDRTELGPSGNGKTEIIKVILKECGYPVLYVNSFADTQGSVSYT